MLSLSRSDSWPRERFYSVYCCNVHSRNDRSLSCPPSPPRPLPLPGPSITLTYKINEGDVHIVMLTQIAQVPIKLLNSLLVRLGPLALQSLVKLDTNQPDSNIRQPKTMKRNQLVPASALHASAALLFCLRAVAMSPPLLRERILIYLLPFPLSNGFDQGRYHLSLALGFRVSLSLRSRVCFA